MSYRLLGEHKRLVVFPLISSVAAVLVLASFLLPLWQMDLLSEWWQFMDEESMAQGDPLMYLVVFLFYFCNYFTIVFFNTGLMACTLKIINGEEAPVSYGLSFAAKRLPQIVGWALVSAVVGVLLEVVERANKKAGALIASLLGSAWTALTYFVVPVIVVDGVGPVEAFKRSTRALKSTWGTALVGNFSLNFFSFLFTVPLMLILFVLFWLAMSNGSEAGMVAVGVLAVPLIMVVIAITSAADAIFKTFLFTYATGRTVPAGIDTAAFADAFRQRD
ncbi:MAG: DUF6159 family protein [Planctomycetota bacterium]